MGRRDTLTDSRASIEVGEGKSPKKILQCVLSTADIRHNMIVLVMLDAIFVMGATDLPIVANPLYVYLGASNTLIGLIASLGMASLVGVFVSPFISLRFRTKKWYLLAAHVPYLGAWGIIGAVLVLYGAGLTKAWLLGFVVVMMTANNFFAGFVPLPHQEYTAACIPMSHRGRFTGYSQSIGSIAGVCSAAIGGWVLLHIAKPQAFGYLFLMVWLICQGGYLLALLGRERPTPVEKAPRPWSKAMIKAAWDDKPFLRLVLLNALYIILFMPIYTTFLSVYAFREIGMIAATAATMSIVMQIVRIGSSSLIGHLTDKLSPKRILPFWPIVMVLALLSALILHNQWGVYAGVALAAVFFVGQQAAFLALIYGLPSPENRSGHYTVQILVSGLAWSAGPLVVGFMCDRLSYRGAFAVVILAGLAMVPISRHLLSALSDKAQDYS